MPTWENMLAWLLFIAMELRSRSSAEYWLFAPPTTTHTSAASMSARLDSETESEVMKVKVASGFLALMAFSIPCWMVICLVLVLALAEYRPRYMLVCQEPTITTLYSPLAGMLRGRKLSLFWSMTTPSLFTCSRIARRSGVWL